MRVSSRERFELRGGEPCLDFVNTVSWRLTDEPIDYLGSPEDLLAWGRQAGLLPAGARDEPGPSERQRDAAMEATLARGRALRETIHRMLTAAMDGLPPDGDDLAVLNHTVSDALSRMRLVRARGGNYEWGWDEGHDAERVLWMVTRSAAELLGSPALGRVRMCAGPGCGWMFLDTSRNQSRRWCDSRDCGNRERVRRHLARRRGDSPGS